ncbi:hypothetical protein B0H19DRAFT_1058500 [Mycena capillaripes]|nr:hypothetical protein B0H19DRAFT_1058500 [Mycena capillaripes]
MPSSFLSSAAGPSAILQVLSECCALTEPLSSSVSPDPKHSSISKTPPPASVKAHPDILLQLNRRRPSEQKKMIAASKFNTAGSGLRLVAPQRNFETPAHKISFRSEALTTSNSKPSPIGLGILVRSLSTDKVHLLSPLSMRRASPTLGVPYAQKSLPRRLRMASGPLMVRADGVAPSSAQRAPPPIVRSPGYTGLGRGLPSHMHANSRRNSSCATARTRLASGLTITSGRSISQLLGIVPSGSYPHSLLNAMPALTRYPRTAAATRTTLNHLRGGPHTPVCSPSIYLVTPALGPQFDGPQKAAQILKKAWAALARIIDRKHPETKAGYGAGNFDLENPDVDRRGVSVYISVARCERVL